MDVTLNRTSFSRNFPYVLLLFCCMLLWMPIMVQAEPLRIFVSILPQEYFVERIGGKRVLVAALVQPGHSPATYAPTPNQMAMLADAKLYFRIGVPFENGLLPKLTRTLPGLKVIDLREGIELLALTEAHADHNEREGDLDPHTWLDPLIALQQALLIRDTLVAYDPDGTAEYHANCARLTDELRQLDLSLKQVLQPFAGSAMYVFHPAYGYFCRAYNLKQKAINPSGKPPGAKHLARLIEEAKNDRIRVIFVQPQFSDKSAATIAKAVNASVVALDPLAKDYIANMKFIAGQLSVALPVISP